MVFFTDLSIQIKSDLIFPESTTCKSTAKSSVLFLFFLWTVTIFSKLVSIHQSWFCRWLNDLAVAFFKSTRRSHVLLRSWCQSIKSQPFDLLWAAILCNWSVFYAVDIWYGLSQQIPHRRTFHLPLHVCHLESTWHLCQHPTHLIVLVQLWSPTEHAIGIH